VFSLTTTLSRWGRETHKCPEALEVPDLTLTD